MQVALILYRRMHQKRIRRSRSKSKRKSWEDKQVPWMNLLDKLMIKERISTAFRNPSWTGRNILRTKN